MPVTERLIIPVKGGVDDWKEQVKVLLQTVKKQEGNIRTRWGPHSENQNMLEFLIGTFVRTVNLLYQPLPQRLMLNISGWESTEAQAKFQASSDFESMMSTLKPVVSGPSTVYFVQFVPYAPKEVIDSPLVEVLTITGSKSSEDELRSAVESYRGAEGCNGVGSGLSLSDVDGKGKVFVAVIGWNSLEESEKGRVAKPLSVDGQTGLHHVNFRFPIKGFRGL
jgi:quinol monooxygenase YgiN